MFLMLFFYLCVFLRAASCVINDADYQETLNRFREHLV